MTQEDGIYGQDHHVEVRQDMPSPADGSCDISIVNSEDEDDETEDDDNEQAVDQPIPGHRRRKLLTSNRLVISIASCLNPDNFFSIDTTSDTKGDKAEQDLIGYMGPKSN